MRLAPVLSVVLVAACASHRRPVTPPRAELQFDEVPEQNRITFGDSPEAPNDCGPAIEHSPDAPRTFEGALASKTQHECLQRASGERKLSELARHVLATGESVLIEVHGHYESTISGKAEAVEQRLIELGVPDQRIHIASRIGPAEPMVLRMFSR